MNADAINERYYGSRGSDRDSEIAQKRIHWMITNARGKRVLDAGCSQGISSLLLAREGFEVLGIDVEKDSIAYANKELERESDSVQKRVTFQLGDLAENLSAHGKFDTILLGEVMEHLAYPNRVLANLRECLSEGGRIVVTVPFGMHRFHDHKRTYLISSFVDSVQDLFAPISLDTDDRYLFSVLEIKQGDQSPTQDWRKFLEQTERSFLTLQKRTHDELTEFKDRIRLLGERRTNELLKIDSSLQQLDQRYQKKDQAWEAQFREEVRLKDVEIVDLRERNTVLAEEAGILGKEAKVLRERAKVLQTQLGSLRYALGQALSDAILRPGMNTLLLPIRVVGIGKRWFCEIRSQRESHGPIQTHEPIQAEDSRPSIGSGSSVPVSELDRDSILFVPVNGVGLGHLTRCLAVSRVVASRSPERVISYFTTSIALPILHREGIPAYHLPSRSALSDLRTSDWNRMLENSLHEVIEISKPGTFVFDGTMPYGGIRRVFSAYPNMKKIWIKRGLYRDNEIDAKLAQFLGDFDRIIVPGELASDCQKGALDNKFDVDPIVLGERVHLLGRDEACKKLGLDPARRTAYIQLGAGNINDIHGLTTQVLAALGKLADIQIVLGESPIAKRTVPVTDECKVISEFPNYQYFNAFDLAVLAAGYNSVYESMYFGLPAIFFPNLATGSDDQMARARIAERKAGAFVFDRFDEETFVAAASKMLAEQKLRRTKYQVSFENGAEAAAKVVLGEDQPPAVTEREASS
jgi:2-polyprenyl-3-methyl-5-hydroxy-6-metoxy-1,4-benzoquinol methylase